MEQTKDLFKALVNNDYSQAKVSLQDAVKSIISSKLEAKKQEIRDQLSTDIED